MHHHLDFFQKKIYFFQILIIAKTFILYLIDIFGQMIFINIPKIYQKYFY
jgi:hypothetical protein